MVSTCLSIILPKSTNIDHNFVYLYIIFTLTVNEDTSKVRCTAAFVLLLPGKVLHLSALIAFQHLESSDLGKLCDIKSARGTDKASTCIT